MIGYTNPDYVAIETGIKGNTKVSSESIILQIDGAEGLVNGTIGNIYDLPLPYRMQNYIDFSGKVTNAGTITVTIGGADYSFSVTLGQTAEEVADLFRTSIDNQETIKVDTTYDRPGVQRVLFVSTSMVHTLASQQVDISNIDLGAVTGISTNTPSALMKRYPLTVELITRLLAAARVLSMSFGKSATGSDNDGPAKWKEAMDLLDKIAEKEIKIIDDIEGGEIGRSDAILPQFNPTKANTVLGLGEENATPRFFYYRKTF